MTHHIVTHSLNEPVMLPLWLKYHGRSAPKAKLHVIFIEAFPGELQMLQTQFPDVVFYSWSGPGWGCDVSMTGAVIDYVAKMYTQGAKVVIHLDADEFLIPLDPNEHVEM